MHVVVTFGLGIRESSLGWFCFGLLYTKAMFMLTVAIVILMDDTLLKVNNIFKDLYGEKFISFHYGTRGNQDVWL